MQTHVVWEADRWPNFVPEEFRCRHCGKLYMVPSFLDLVQETRRRLGFPLHVTSGYRCEEHPIEAAKPLPGAHCLGRAVDVAVGVGGVRYKILEEALLAGFTGIGVGRDFLHLDTIDHAETHLWRPCVWTY